MALYYRHREEFYIERKSRLSQLSPWWALWPPPPLSGPRWRVTLRSATELSLLGACVSLPLLAAIFFFFTVCRYVERNPLRANLVARAEDWRWSSLWQRCHDTAVPWLSAWPLAVPEHWLDYVNGAETEGELAALRRSVVRGAPYGEAMWQQQTAAALGLESALRKPGRPKIAKVTPQQNTKPNLTNLTPCMFISSCLAILVAPS